MIRSLAYSTIALTLLVVVAWAASPADPSAALKQEIEGFSFSGTFEQALTELAKQGNLKIQPDWNAMAAVGAKKDAPVDVKADKASLEQLLEIAVSQASPKDHPLAWRVDGTVVRVSTQAQVLQQQTPSPTPAKSKGPSKGSTESETISFKETKLVDALKYIQKVSDLNFNVNWSSLETVGITKDTAISIEVRNITVARALDLVLDQASSDKAKLERAYWVLDDGVVTIASGNALNTELKSKVYDVTDLLVVIPDYAPTGGTLTIGNTSMIGTNSSTNSPFSGSTDNGSNSADDSIGAKRAKVRETLMGAIKDSIGDDMWKPDGKGSIRILDGKLIITQTQLGFKLLEKATKMR